MERNIDDLTIYTEGIIYRHGRWVVWAGHLPGRYLMSSQTSARILTWRCILYIA